MSIQNFLDLSTGHLPVSDRLRLDQLASRDLPFRVFGHQYGWNIWLCGEGKQFDQNIEALEEVYGFTDALGHVLRYARQHECDMVNFDRDAEQIDSLGYFEDGDSIKCPNCLEDGFNSITRQCLLCEFDETNDPNTW